MLDAHPAIGQRTGLSARSAAEQGADADPDVLAELARLNAEYEARHGFRFVVFVEPAPEGRDPRGAPQPDRQPDRRRARDGARRARRDRRGPLATRVTASLPLALSDALSRLARPRAALAARDRRDGVDRHVVLLRPPRPVAPAAEGPADADAGVGGELWEVHGGGFYQVQKYVVAPPRAARPPRLVQVGGVRDVALGLRADARPLLPRGVERARPAGRRPRAVARGDDLDRAARRRLARRTTCSTALVSDGARPLARPLRARRARGVGLGELFSPRAAWLQVGAMIGTVMAANVFFDIIPAHWELIRAKEAGREPDPRPGIQAKQRSVHNNYLTLPVLLTMLGGPLPVRVRRRPRLARPRRPDGCSAPGRVSSSTSATRAARSGGCRSPAPWPSSRSRSRVDRSADTAAAPTDAATSRRASRSSSPPAAARATRSRTPVRPAGRPRPRRGASRPPRSSTDRVRERAGRDAVVRRDADRRARSPPSRPTSRRGRRIGSRPHARDHRRRVRVHRATRGGATRRRRSPRSAGSSRSSRGSSTSAGRARPAGSRSATSTSGSARRTRPATRTRASSSSTPAASRRPRSCSRTATSTSPRRPASSRGTTSRRSSRATRTCGRSG